MIDLKNRKKRRLNIFIVIFLLGVLLVGGYFGYQFFNKEKSGEENLKSNITPLLYEVTKEGSSNKMYLFGSIHVANKSDLVFPEYILNAYKNSHYLACEVDLIAYQEDQEKVLTSAMEMIYSDDTTIKDHLSETTYNKLVDFLTKKNMYNNLYEMYKPFFFSSLISNAMANDSKLDGENGIDNYFLKKAKEDNKTIIEVESFESQLDLLMSFSDKLYDLMLSEEIDNYDESVTQIAKLYEAWKKGNATDLLNYATDDMEVLDSYTKEQKKMVKEYNQKLVSERNEEMTKKAIEYFNNNQDVFFMVGALHIIGDNGLVNGLTEKGFTVKAVN